MELVLYFLVFLVLLPLLKPLLLPVQNLPPSPWGLPLLGHLHLLGTMPHRSLQALSKKFGDLMFLRFGTVPTVVVSSPEMVKEVFKNHDLAFSYRPYMVVGEYQSYNFKNMALSSGDHWKNVRKFCTTELFTARRLESFSSMQLAEVSIALSTLAKAQQSVVVLREVVTATTFNIITEIVMRKRFFGESVSKKDAAEAEVFKEVMAETVLVAFQLHISEFIPSWLRWIDWTRPQLRRLFAKQDKFLQNIVDDRRSSNTSKSLLTADFLDTLLKHKQDEDVVKAVMIELITAGTDTAACTLEWAFLELLNNPEVMAKLQKELDAVIDPDRMVIDSDFQNLPYLRAVVKETFRLHAPAPLLVPRMTAQACVVAGYNIPKGSTTIVNYYSIGRDPRFWENPTKFCLERFEGSTMDVKGQDFELVPFGGGRRICPGMAIGLKNVYLVLANFVHSFNFSCVPEGSYEIEETFGAVAWPKSPVQVQVSARRTMIR